MPGFFLKNRLLFFLIPASALLYFFFAYRLVRPDFFMLMGLYAALFLLFYLLMRAAGKRNFTVLLVSGIMLRLVFLPALPNLSQDFYRFLWDGRLLLLGINPYLYTPDMLIGQLPAEMGALYEGMGALSASHYTNYPPVSQFIFALSAAFSGSVVKSVVIIRLLLIAADMGVVYFGRKLLRRFRLPDRLIFWYFLNPFIIIELTGNLHFEGVMLFFLLWALYALFTGLLYRSAILFAVAVSVKLIPFLLLPLLLQRLGWGRMAGYGLMVIVSALIVFAPFISGAVLNNFWQTTGLWFTNFEFNASWYYVVREIGFRVKGYNIIGTFGAVLPWLIAGTTGALALFRNNRRPVWLLTGMLLALAGYYFMATTVHPWYIALLVGLSVFTRYRFPIVWSGVIMLSYYAYSDMPFRENTWLLVLEYVVVYGVLIWEVFFKLPAKGGSPVIKLNAYF